MLVPSRGVLRHGMSILNSSSAHEISSVLKGRAFLRFKLICTSMIMIFKCIAQHKSQLWRLWTSVGPFYYPGRSRLLHCDGNSRAPPSYFINLPWRISDYSHRSSHRVQGASSTHSQWTHNSLRLLLKPPLHLAMFLLLTLTYVL